MQNTIGRIWFLVVALISGIGVIASALLSGSSEPITLAQEGGMPDPAYFDSYIARFTNTFFYFTILSNVLVCVTSAMLAVRFERHSKVFAIFRLFSIVGIIITGIIYNTILAQYAHPEGIAYYENFMVHVASPILTVIGWLLFGPRLKFRLSVWLGSICIGIAWVAVTLVRGALIHWYPYPFLNVDQIGYAQTLINTVGIAVFGLILGAIILGLDKVLPGTRLGDEEPAPDAEPSAPAAAG